MRLQTAKPDSIVAEIAARQHGVITYAQLLWAGLTQSGIQRRVAAGRLHWIYRGVYAVGHDGLSREGRWKAATLACGPGAALSHRSAAELWRMLEPSDGPSHVTVRARGGRSHREGIRLHRSRSLTRRMITSESNIPVTRPPRTLEDLKRDVSAGELRRALRQAEFLNLPIHRVAIVDDRTGNELELALLRLCRRHRLPEPESNVRIGPFEVDFLWRQQRLVVETDGWGAHRGSVAFELDHRRDAYLISHGYFVLRFTRRQVLEEPTEVAALIRDSLAP